MEERFTVAEIKNYIVAQDNLTQVYFNLCEANIIAANGTFCTCETPFPASIENYCCVMCQKPILPKEK